MTFPYQDGDKFNLIVGGPTSPEFSRIVSEEHLANKIQGRVADLQHVTKTAEMHIVNLLDVLIPPSMRRAQHSFTTNSKASLLVIDIQYI